MPERERERERSRPARRQADTEAGLRTMAETGRCDADLISRRARILM